MFEKPQSRRNFKTPEMTGTNVGGFDGGYVKRFVMSVAFDQHPCCSF